MHINRTRVLNAVQHRQNKQIFNNLMKLWLNSINIYEQYENINLVTKTKLCIRKEIERDTKGEYLTRRVNNAIIALLMHHCIAIT